MQFYWKKVNNQNGNFCSNQNTTLPILLTFLSTILLSQIAFAQPINQAPDKRNFFGRGTFGDNPQSPLVMPVVGKGNREFNMSPPLRVSSPSDAQALVEKIRSDFELRMQKLYTNLQITNDQQNEWNQYLETSRQQLPDLEMILQMSQKRSEGQTPAKARGELNKMQKHMDNLQKSVDAYESLYNKSTDKQQQVLRSIDFRAMPIAEPRNMRQHEQFPKLPQEVER